MPPDEPPPHTVPGELIREGTAAARFLAFLRPEQVQMFLVVGMVGVLIWQQVQADGRQIEREAQTQRFAEGESEKVRLHCAGEGKELRSHFAAMDRERNRADLEREKIRAASDQQVATAMGTLSARLADLERALKKHDPDPSPMPRAKSFVGPPERVSASGN